VGPLPVSRPSNQGWALSCPATDKYNQQLYDWMEKFDDGITDRLAELQVAPAPDAPQNTEIPGSILDRRSILALRTHLLEGNCRAGSCD
jgi:hypothetical protein